MRPRCSVATESSLETCCGLCGFEKGVGLKVTLLRVLFRKRWDMAWMLKTIEMKHAGRG